MAVGHVLLCIGASFSLAYLLAAIAYLCVTASWGSPFKDSLTAAQRTLKRRAVRRRGRVFSVAFAVALAASLIVLLCAGGKKSTQVAAATQTGLDIPMAVKEV